MPALRFWSAHVPALIVAALSLAYQVQQGTTADVSWLITLSERLLDGQTAYVDFFEVNPPASILLYVPAVAVARLLRVAPEAAVKASVFLVFAANVVLCRRILRDEGASARYLRGLPLACLAAVYLLLPGDAFAQREHFIVVFLLPLLCVLTVRARRLLPPTTPAIIAGLEAGAAVAVKPYFIAAVALPLVYVVWRHRGSWRAGARIVLAPEAVAITFVCLAYLAAIPVAFPAFLTLALPIAVDVYGLYTNSHLAFLYSWNAILWAVSLVATLSLMPWTSGDAAPVVLTRVLALGSAGCVAAMMFQARYFDYHAYPSIALALSALALTVCCAWSERSAATGRGSIVPLATASILAGAIFVRGLVWFAAPVRDDRLAVALSRLSPHTRIMALSMGHGLAHPLVRTVGGTFVGRLIGPWMYFLVKRALRDPSLPLERRRVLQGYVELEKDVVARDIDRARPDLILVSREFDTDAKIDAWPFIDENWIKSTPALIAALARYAPIESVGNVTIWARKAPRGH